MEHSGHRTDHAVRGRVDRSIRPIYPVKIAILKERAAGETRVAATPETVKKFIGLGNELAVEKGAGAVSYTHLTLPTILLV